MKKDDSIRKRLHELVDTADSKTLRTLEEIIGAASEWKDDKEFVEELKQRWNEYVNGGKTFTHEEVMETARKALKSAKRRSA